MKQFLLVLIVAISTTSFSQNNVYCREGFEPSGTSPCDLSTTYPATSVIILMEMLFEVVNLILAV